MWLQIKELLDVSKPHLLFWVLLLCLHLLHIWTWPVVGWRCEAAAEAEAAAATWLCDTIIQHHLQLQLWRVTHRVKLSLQPARGFNSSRAHSQAHILPLLNYLFVHAWQLPHIFCCVCILTNTHYVSSRLQLQRIRTVSGVLSRQQW